MKFYAWTISIPEDDPVQRQPDITRAKTQLGWTPEVGLDEGLKPTVAYFQSLM
jgi:UDP-glucuronate decarboxylase